MAKHRIPVFDGDGHVIENYDEMFQCFEGEYARLQNYIGYDQFPPLDGWPRGLYMSRSSKRKYTSTSAAIWAEMLDDLGAQGSVLYPTLGLAHGLVQDPEWAGMIANAYDNWIERHYTTRDSRLHAVGLLAVQNPPAAVAEMRRCKAGRKNFVAMLMPSVTRTGRLYGDRMFWPIYEAAEALDMPLAVHGGSAAGFSHDLFDNFAKVRVLHHPVPIFTQLTDMIFSGVFDAFPKLRVAYLEAGCGWVPWLMDRLDHELAGPLALKSRGRVKRKPSEYILEGENIWFGMELEEGGLAHTIDVIGADRIIYASDYPHESPPEEIVGELPEFIAESPLSDAVKRKLLHDNAMRFYRLG